MSKELKSEVAWRGDSVTIGDVLNALSGIRRKFAQADAGDEEQPHPRNCVMSLVAVATSAADELRAQRACTAVSAGQMAATSAAPSIVGTSARAVVVGN